MLDSQSRRTKQRYPATEPDRQRSVDVTPDSLTGAVADDEWLPGLNSSELFRCQKLENNSCLMTFVFRWSRGTAEIQSWYSDFLLVEPPAFVQTFIYSIWLSEGGNPGLDHPFPTSSRINDSTYHRIYTDLSEIIQKTRAFIGFWACSPFYLFYLSPVAGSTKDWDCWCLIDLPLLSIPFVGPILFLNPDQYSWTTADHGIDYDWSQRFQRSLNGLTYSIWYLLSKKGICSRKKIQF